MDASSKYKGYEKTELENLIFEKFTLSHDFNGIAVETLCEHQCEQCESRFLQKASELDDAAERILLHHRFCQRDTPHFEQVKIYLKELIEENKICLVRDLNPHIKRFPEESRDAQIKHLDENFQHVCVYPSREVLASKVSNEKFANSPFSRRLLLGEAQLKPTYFELAVLDIYAQDPRFDFAFNDYQGRISLKEEFQGDDHTHERDHTFLESFGLAYKENGKRAVVVWVSDLARLTPEHQQRWLTFEAHGTCKMDPDYYKNQIEGAFAAKVSIYEAIVHEMKIINEFCHDIGWKPLFRDTFVNNRPEQFRMPFSSTSEGFLKTVDTLDKMLSQNLNMKFFKDHLRADELYETETHQASGQQTVRDLGTLKLLSKWIKKSFRPVDAKEASAIDEAIETFETIRSIRQIPAHKISANSHDIIFDKYHDRMIEDTFSAIRLLRLILANHPKADRTRVPTWLYEGKVRSFFSYDISYIVLSAFKKLEKKDS